MNPNTDIVITYRSTGTFPTGEVLQKCIETLELHTHNYRLIFVDDGSDIGGRECISNIADRFPDCVMVRTHRQHWFTRAVNLGLSVARTPHVVVLNSDTVCDTGWLEELYAVKDEVEATSGRVGLVGSIQSGEEPRRYALSGHPDYVTGHAWLLNMSAMYEASVHHNSPGIYLDQGVPGLIHINSDVYICWELNAMGWNCVKAFKSNVGHLGGRSWGHALALIPRSLDEVNYNYRP